MSVIFFLGFQGVLLIFKFWGHLSNFLGFGVFWSFLRFQGICSFFRFTVYFYHLIGLRGIFVIFRLGVFNHFLGLWGILVNF